MRASISVALFSLLAGCGGAGTAASLAPALPGTTAPAALYVANVRAANVVHLNASGAPQLVLQGGISPSGVATTSTGDIAIAGNQKNVLFFHPGSIAPFNTLTSAVIDATRGIAADGAGAVYVGDPIADTIYEFAPGASGAVSPIAQLHVVESHEGKLLAFDVDGAGNLYVLAGDASAGIAPAIRVYRGGTFTKAAEIASGTEFPHPAGIAVDASGNIFVNDGGSALMEYDTDGAFGYPTHVRRPVSGLCGVTALRAAVVNGKSYVFAANGCASGGSVTVYDAGAAPASGIAAPAFTIAGSATQLGVAIGTQVAVDRSGGPSDGTVYVNNPQVNTVNGYCFASCFGDANPSSQIATGYPGMDGVQAIWFASGFMYTTDSATPAISIYAAPSNGATGTQQPATLARIIGPDAAICGAAYALTDAHGNLLVAMACADKNGNYVAKYALPPNMRGDNDLTPTPFAGAPGACGGTQLMCNPQQMLLDGKQNLYVTNYGNTSASAYDAGSILKFSPTGALTAILKSADIHNPSGIALDSAGNIGVLSNLSTNGSTPEIAFFSPPADQRNPNAPLTVAPLGVISGAATQLGGTPFPQMVIDRDGTIYVDEFNEILTFAPRARGNAAPEAVFANASLTGGTGLALQP